MIFVWYNPDSLKYEIGTMLEFDRKLLNSANRDRFNLIYEFQYFGKKMAEKTASLLNQAREFSLGNSKNI